MRRAPLHPPDRNALADFVQAVRSLSDDPDTANLERYLAASKALEESRSPNHSQLNAERRAA